MNENLTKAWHSSQFLVSELTDAYTETKNPALKSLLSTATRIRDQLKKVAQATL